MVLLVCFDFFTHVFLAGASSLSVSLCQYQFTQRGAVLWQHKMNWIIFVLSILPTQSCLRFLFTCIAFFSLIECGFSGLEVISFKSFYGGCRCEWLFRLQWPARVSFGLQWPLEVFTLWRLFVETESLVDCLGLQWPLEFLLGCSGLSR